jgi:hypothetical protein
MAQPDVDGALVGGASLDPEEFARIVQFAAALTAVGRPYPRHESHEWYPGSRNAPGLFTN